MFFKKKTKQDTSTTDAPDGTEDELQMTYSVERQPAREDEPLYETFSASFHFFGRRSDKDSAAEAPGREVHPAPEKGAADAGGGDAPPKRSLWVKYDLRRWMIFVMPLIFFWLYVGFYMVLIPALYGQSLSFFDWILADVDHIIELLRDINNILVPAYAIILLIILQYLLLGALLTSLFFLAKELHAPKLIADKRVKYTGKVPLKMLEGILMTIREDRLYARGAVEELKTVVNAMRYSKAFGVSGEEAMIVLEQEICALIDRLQAGVAAASEQSARDVEECIISLKQKTVFRDMIMKK